MKATPTGGAEVQTKVTFPPSATVQQQAEAAANKVNTPGGGGLQALSSAPDLKSYGSFTPSGVVKQEFSPPSPPPPPPPPPPQPQPKVELSFDVTYFSVAQGILVNPPMCHHGPFVVFVS